MTETGGGGNWRSRVTAMSNKVPTKWLVTAVVAVFLAGSAAFGGLNTVAADAQPEVAAGSAYDGAQLDIAVAKAVLIDGFPEQGIRPDEGKRFFVVDVTITNVWDEPVTTYDKIGAADNIRPVGIAGIAADTPPDNVVIVDDGTRSPRLQPNVPVRLAFMWQVDPGTAAGIDSVRINLYDKVYVSGGFVTYGERWNDPFVAAFTTVPLTDVGAGADAAGESGS
ncbi:hypothetical protein B7R21_07695 [Subtercola boreus]|uniref:DUF4352 domain-containing protein n=1 Tax=Subtercola boreus TaxID=120213 RepID=A0A3E0VWG9_9MICO|nr:hypothetical protein [Subtercola boreus]RFA13708.1 hypothetical protein B7R21_07695 [Subtercola boreus]